ncbi:MULTISPECIES: tetratricopeptide repeat protein [Bacteroidota]|uniref:Tetratricopeptide repeat protein n=1 Tax=Flectobacillus rivi TaxID=2984209 RepID=A0ABT6Z8Y2_9BACT|nr:MULTISPECIES: tetratricopeptide repeat protein [Bacteroidota]MDI9877593.1 tetratricopeptide repeat protein [Flectobacillus rivi]NBB30131.1 tetratricopeptide repeat protein [Cellulophaga sp. BC115SP]
MQKSFIFIIVVALGTVGALYSLPKVVVSDEKKTLEQTAQTGSANRDKAVESEDTHQHTEGEASESHGTALSPEQSKVVESLRAKYLGSSSKQDKIEAANALISKFTAFTRYDSAAYYAEEVVKLDNNERNLMKAADLYYEAFTYALEDAKTKNMGEKARTLYQEILTKNPNNLLAKTNMAMTYVSTSTPMQGILMLREVIAKEPEFEPALFNLGILSIRSNQFGKAVERFKQILKINPANSKAALNLGYCLAELDRTDEARTILEKVLANSKDPQEKAAANEILSKLK